MTRAAEWGDRIPLGLLYKDEQPTYEDSEAVFKKGPLTQQPLRCDKAVFKTLIDENM